MLASVDEMMKDSALLNNYSSNPSKKSDFINEE